MEYINFKLISRTAAAIIALILIVALWPISSVPTGYRGVITVGGAIRGIEPEGYLVIMPWQKLTSFNIRAESADVKNAEGATSDTQPVSTSMTVRYSISPDKVGEVYEKYSHDGNLDSYVHTATLETFKAVTARYTAPELIAKRQLVGNDIASLLRVKVALYGAQIINIDMTGFSFSPTYMAAINEKVTQEQLRLGADNKFLTVQSEQKQKVAIATAEADAVKATADGNAYAQLKIATAQADALKVQNAALAQNKDVLELRRIEVTMEQARRWDGKLPVNMYAGAPLPLLNLSAPNK
jgi:prohibitin 2